MKKLLLLSAAGIAIAGTLAFASGYAIAPMASHFLRQNGFPEAKVTSAGLTPHGIIIDHIALDGNDFSTIDGANIIINWYDFLSSREIDSLSVKNISLTGEMDEQNQLKIAGWDATVPSNGNHSSALLPFRALLIQGATLDISTPDGDIRVEGKLSVSSDADNRKQNVQYALWAQQHQLSFDAKGSGTLSDDGHILLSTTLNDGRVNIGDTEISRASGWIDFAKSSPSTPPYYSGQILAGKVNALGHLFQDVTITLDTKKPESLFFKTSPAGHPNISLTGRWLTAPDNVLNLSVISLSSEEFIQLSMPEKAEAILPWVKTANPLSLTLQAPLSALKDINKTAIYTLNLGNTDSPASLLASGKIIHEGGKNTTTIQADMSRLGMAGGNVEISPFSFPIGYAGTPPLDVSLTLTNIDMQKLADFADIDGLKAEGTLNGTVPVTYSDKGFVIGNAAVKTTGDGKFSYAPSQFPPSLQGEDDRMVTVRQALSDFHFTSLETEISGAVDGKMKTTLKAEGTSPLFGDRPIKLNLNLDGDLGSVLKQALQAGDIGNKIRSEIMGADKK